MIDDMSIETALKSHTVQPKVFLYISLAVVALLLALHLFMLFVLFPNQGGSMNLHMPGRSGGYDLYVDVDRFKALNGAILSVAVALAVVVMGMVRSKKAGIAVVVTILLLFSSIV